MLECNPHELNLLAGDQFGQPSNSSTAFWTVLGGQSSCSGVLVLDPFLISGSESRVNMADESLTTLLRTSNLVQGWHGDGPF